MRIIAGKFRSRKLLSPPIGASTRPIPDRVKESLFSLLRGHFEGATVLDAFAGTGAIGLEAVSRGAARVVMVERDKRAAEVIRRNIEMLGCTGEAEVVVGDMLGGAALARVPRPIDLVFFDPPYALVADPLGWERVKQQFGAAVRLLADDGFAVLRTPWPFRHVPGGADLGPALDESGEVRRVETEPDHRRSRGERRWDWRSELERPDDKDGKHKRAPNDEAVDEAGADLDELAEAGDEFPLDERDGEPLEEAEPGPAPGALGAPPAPTPFMVDLRIPGGKGPETHVYRHTGVHLYMKEAPKGAPADGDPGSGA
jgi:16S rRNA (guanine966-N2)-methyltransferase